MKNIILNILNWVRYFLKYKKQGKYSPAKDRLMLQYQYHFSLFKIWNDVFYKGFKWGRFHPKHTHTYFSNKPIETNSEGLQLRNIYNPKWFDSISKYIDFEQDVVNSVNTYKYGYFEVECKLPDAHGSWPAFWLIGEDHREIDVFEGYNYLNSNYRNSYQQKNVRIQPNVHYPEGIDNKHEMIGAKNCPMPMDVTKSFNKYGVLWLPDKIEFYYNRRLVRSVTDKNIVNKLNKPMTIVMNNGKIYDNLNQNPSLFIVKSLSIWQ